MCLERNKKINSEYGRVFKKNNELLWAGAASFASKQVGCGLESAKSLIDSSKRSLEAFKEANKVIEEHPFLYPAGSEPAFAEAASGYQNRAAQVLFDGLAKGNQELFSEVNPLLQMYSQHGADNVLQCAARGAINIPRDLHAAVEFISKGNTSKGAELMLLHEQRDTLQRIVYDDPAFASVIRVNQLGAKAEIGKLFGAEDIKVSFTAQCSGGTEVQFNDSNLADFKQRWPYATEVSDTFQKLWLENPDLIRAQVDAIIDR